MIAVESALSVEEAWLLGIVQGLTEFLPVSSSGHLAVVQHLLTPMPPEQHLLRPVREGRLRWFAYYSWVLGLTVLVAATVFGRA